MPASVPQSSYLECIERAKRALDSSEEFACKPGVKQGGGREPRVNMRVWAGASAFGSIPLRHREARAGVIFLWAMPLRRNLHTSAHR